MARFGLSVAMAACLAACASVPDVEYSYYLPKSDTQLTLNQSIDCNAAKTNIVVVNSGSVATVYSADFDKQEKIRIKAIEGSFPIFEDSDVGFGFYEDGRLKSVNQTTTGEAEAIIKSAISLAAAAAPFFALVDQTLPECDTINKWGAGKPVTITFNSKIDGSTPTGVEKSMDIAQGSAELYAELNATGRFPAPHMKITRAPINGAGAHYVGTTPNAELVMLTLRKTAVETMEIAYKGTQVWTGNAVIPMAGTYDLPIPKAALFGKQSFTLAIAESGAITSVDYLKNTGAAGALNAGTSIATAAAGETPAQKAADLKAKADEIAQAQRYARCLAQPDKCQ